MTWSKVLRRAFTAATLFTSLAWLPAARAGDGDVTAEIVVQALALLGVPYRWGGNDPARGLDCSGLVRHVVKSVGPVELPRRSEEMRRVGLGVNRADLRAGDLVFFNTLGHPFSHVAIYVGDGRFVHAPGRHGQVRVDEIDDRYWRARFNGARRIAGLFAAQITRATEATRAELAARSLRWEDFPEGP
jgi:cell wall-associated NlpC family hydrolase